MVSKECSSVKGSRTSTPKLLHTALIQSVARDSYLDAISPVYCRKC